MSPIAQRPAVIIARPGDEPLTLRVRALPDTVGFVRRVVRNYAAHHTSAAADDVALAVSEALTNAVMHAYVDKQPGPVQVVASATIGEGLIVSVTDNGSGMCPRPDSPGAGLGLAVIGRVASALRIDTPRSGGTRVSMRFDAVARSRKRARSRNAQS